MTSYIRVVVVLALVFPAFPLMAQEASQPLFIVHFSTGPAWDKSLTPGEQDGFAQHSANLKRLRAAGVIVFGARYDEYGMVVVRAESLAAATKLMEADPGVQSGIFVFKVSRLHVFYPWPETKPAS